MAARKTSYGWIVDFWLNYPDGRRERIRRKSPVQTKRGAERFDRELREELLNPTVPEVPKEVPTFERFVTDQWLPVYPHSAGNRPSTIKEKESHIRLYLMPAFGPHRLDEIKSQKIEQLFSELRKRGLAEKTIKNARATLRRILASAVDWEVIDKLPRLPIVKVPEAPFDFLQPEESDRVIAAARNPNERALLLFALRTGARAGEQIAFEWGDIDWANGHVLLRRSRAQGVLGPRKNKKHVCVPMTDQLQAALKAIKQLRGALVFCRPDGSPLKYDYLHERLWGACRRAGLRKIRWHDLRHSFASQLVMNGVSMRQVQEWLGHSTITMTMRYSHLAPGAGKELIGLLDGAGVGQHLGSKGLPGR